MRSALNLACSFHLRWLSYPRAIRARYSMMVMTLGGSDDVSMAVKLLRPTDTRRASLPLEEDGPSTSNRAAGNPTANKAEIPPCPAPLENWCDVRHVRRVSKRFDGEEACPSPFLDLLRR